MGSLKLIRLMVILTIFATLMLSGVSEVFARDTVAQDTVPRLPYAAGGDTRQLNRSLDQDAFRPGELLKLRVTYFGITAGYLEVRVDTDSIEGRDLYRLTMDAYSAGPAAWFYSVRDQLVSYMDREGLFSWGYDFFKEHEDESETTRVRYFHDRGFFTENGERGGEIPPYTQDLLSAVYFVRIQDLAVGQEYKFPIHSSERSYRLTLEVRDSERVATQDGWRDAYKLVPTFERKTDRDEAFEHIKEVQGIKLWIGRDRHKIPLKVALPATFGEVYAYLESFEPGGK